MATIHFDEYVKKPKLVPAALPSKWKHTAD